MKLTKQQKRVLVSAFDDAANLAESHRYAVEKAARLFNQYFGEDVPEEAMGGFASSKEEVGSLFNNYVNYAENLTSDNATTLDLINKITDLMNEVDS
jgi:hypothetical protein